MSKRDLLRYWPREDDVVACVKTDAEASSEAVSLAVHQPMRFERRVIGEEGIAIGLCSEHDLLRAFLTETLPEGRMILPIVGSSGIGKSHVVRWLDAQIRRMPRSERRVVIRIPKGTSLKGVLGILLKELHGPAYDRYRRELVRAQQELDPSEAAGLLCEMLAHTLEEMAAEARAQLLANPADRSAQERDAYCRSDMLPSLLRNQLLREQHFVRKPDASDGVVKRLVEQLTEGRSAGADDDRQHLFTPEDLSFDDRIDRDVLGRVEARALSHFEREDRRAVAARILNAALDDAKQRLLRLDPTVSDLFDAVRRELLSDEKELVLLVEDFAVLSGIQKQLLQVIIKEAIRDGRKELCTMRTALAYTTGYMDTATVLTRANVEYRIPDEPGTEEQILERIARLVGAYLNAARFGQAALEKAYSGRAEGTDELRSWIPGFEARVEPEARATLDAFGTSEDGYEFFPFNRAAIGGLAREGCLHAGRLVFNPRFVIQNVINKVLVQRDLFDQGNFPPATFGGSGNPLPAKVVEDVRRRVQPADLDRYLRFLAYWGNVPSSPAEIGEIEPRIFAAFGLDKALFGRVTPPAPPPPKPGREQEKEPPQPKRSQHVNPIEAKWDEILERWRAGVQIPQADANQLRKWIAEALKGYVDWDWDLFRPRKDGGLDSWFSWIYIPRAAGNEGRGADDAMVAACTDADLADVASSARVQTALMSVVRFHGVHKGTWDYEGADEDLPRYAAFLDCHAERARAFVRRRYFRAEWDPVPALVQGLLIGARALGFDDAIKDKDPAALISSVFASNAEAATQGEAGSAPGADGTGWAEFTEALRKCRRTGEKELRDQLSWTGHLLNILAARQGQADTVHAIDVLRLKRVVEDTLSCWEFSAAPPNPSGVPDFAPVRSTYLELKKLSAAIAKAQRRLSRWRSQMLSWLGEGADKEILVREMKETVEAAKAAGLTRGIDSKEVRRLLDLIEEFRNANVVTALEDAAKLEDEASRGTVLGVLGQGYEPVASLSEDLQTRYDEFARSADAELRNEAVKYGADPLAEAVGTLRTELDEVESLMKELQQYDGA